MKGSSLSLSCVVLLLLLQLGLTFQSTVPAFLWTNYRGSHSNRKDSVDYRTISQNDLARVILAEGGWSNLLCQGENVQEPVDIGLVLVGRELQSSAIFRDQLEDPQLMHFLRSSFSSSNFSMSFPYVSSSEENKNMESSLISGFTESCGHDLGVNSIAFLDSCSLDGGNFQKLAGLHSVQDHLTSVLKNKQKGQKDVIVLCSGGLDYPEEIDHNVSEGEIFSELISSLEKSGASYSVLYASDPKRAAQYPSYKALDRFLAEGTHGNSSVSGSVYCDGVCQIKSSLLEGLLVAIVLLIILISGLCCMMGIDTPSRFEAPQE